MRLGILTLIFATLPGCAWQMGASGNPGFPIEFSINITIEREPEPAPRLCEDPTSDFFCRIMMRREPSCFYFLDGERMCLEETRQ